MFSVKKGTTIHAIYAPHYRGDAPKERAHRTRKENLFYKYQLVGDPTGIKPCPDARKVNIPIDYLKYYCNRGYYFFSAKGYLIRVSHVDVEYLD